MDINEFFIRSCEIITIIGEYTGWGYELSNIILFVFLQPSLILLFFWLWIRAIIKNGRRIYIQKSNNHYTS